MPDMLAVVAIILAGLLTGKMASRLTPVVNLVLFGLVTAIVAAEFLSWGEAGSAGPGDLLRALIFHLR